MRLFGLALALVLMLPVLTAPPAAADEEPAFITKTSPHDVSTTLDRIAAAVTKGGGKVFYRIDHAAAAAEYGKQMPPSQVLIFGNPANGTPLMTKAPMLSVDLPLKVGAFEDSDGTVTLIYRNPLAQFADHGGLDGPAKNIAGLLDKLSTVAISAE